jgi:hypothetical protein
VDAQLLGKHGSQPQAHLEPDHAVLHPHRHRPGRQRGVDVAACCRLRGVDPGQADGSLGHNVAGGPEELRIRPCSR